MNPSASQPNASKGPENAPERLWSALSYVGPTCVASVLLGPHTAFHRWHVAQGFVLFFAEAAALAGMVFVDGTIGRIPVIGFLVMLVLSAAFFVLFLVLSILGFVKSFAGEHLEIAILERYARKLPLVHEGE